MLDLTKTTPTDKTSSNLIEELKTKLQMASIKNDLFEKDLDVYKQNKSRLDSDVSLTGRNFKERMIKYSEVFSMDIDLITAFQGNANDVQKTGESYAEQKKDIDTLVTSLNGLKKTYNQVFETVTPTLLMLEDELLIKENRIRHLEETLESFLILDTQKAEVALYEGREEQIAEGSTLEKLGIGTETHGKEEE